MSNEKWFDDTIYDWVPEERDFGKSFKLEAARYELGGGATWKSLNVIGIALEDANIVGDVTQPGLWDEIRNYSNASFRAKDFLEHIPHCKNSSCTHHGWGEDFCNTHLFILIHQKLVPGGYFISMTPSTDGRGAFQDPTHISFWNENSFWYYTQEQCKFIGLDEPLFEPERVWTGYPTLTDKHNKISYVFAILRKPK